MYKYPYGDSQQLNLDWIISKIKELEAGGSGGAADLEAVANALVTLSFNLNTQYRRYDYCFLNGKLYRCLTDTSGVFDPTAWQEALIGDDLAVLTRWINAIDAAAVVDVKFDTSGTNGKIQQKYHDQYHDVVEVDYTPVQNSKRPLSSNAGYELNGAINSKLPINPESIEMMPSSSSAGHGGFIDFHFNRNSGDRTSRIIESASGVITITPELTLGTPLDVASGGTGNSSVDTTPTENSTKMVTSGGVYNAILGTRNMNSATYSTSGYPYLVNDSVFAYNSVCSTLCVRGVKDIPPTATTKLFSLPANTYPIQNLYEDYVTRNGNHFRFIIVKNDGVYVHNYQETSITDGDLNKTITWAHS